MPDLDVQREQLLAYIRQFDTCAVAFSGGVDSTVVAKATQLALGDKAIAVTAVSPSLASGELDDCVRLARAIGIRHEIIKTDELNDPAYVVNQPDRCYHCKTELYGQLGDLCERFGVQVVFNGANVDDAGDYRPGMQAAQEHAVRSPLAESGYTKADVRRLAKAWALDVWDKPATPCLSSRIAYGEEVTPERLEMIDLAERFLRESGFREFRVRYHRGDLARVEIPVTELPRLAADGFRVEMVQRFRSLGFKYVTVDLEGFRSGSQNLVLPVETLLSGVEDDPADR